MPAELITKREAAQILGVHPSTVQRMIDRGELASATTLVGGRVVSHEVPRTAVERLALRRILQLR